MSPKIFIIAALTLLGSLYLVHHYHSTQRVGSLQTFDHEFYASQQQLLALGNKEVNYEMLYLHYKKLHNLSFGAAEDSTRFNIFKGNCDKILAHNAKNTSYELGLTSLAHLSREEFAATRLGYAGAQKKGNKNAVILNTDNIAEEVDWSAKGAVTDIKNQGQCGSCWAFSTTGALEGLKFNQDGKLISLSEQELVDCSGDYGNQGCNGGLMDYGFQYVAEHGLATEADYPYTGTDGTCHAKGKARAFQNKGFQDVAHDQPDQLAAALNKGPVSVAIEADTEDFQLYKKGILTGDGCGTQLDHGVLAVGYGKDHFKVKNSWGAAWGQNGYVLIGRENGDGVCGINENASYPTL